MASRDDPLDVSRRRLPAVVAQLHGRCAAAEQLLRSKAIRSPNSAEAAAWRMVLEGCELFERFMRGSGLIDGADGADHAQEKAPAQDAGPGIGLVAGGTSSSGQAAHALPH